MGREISLHKNIADENFFGDGTCEKSKIISEISVRILEFREISPKDCVQFLFRILEIYRISPKIFDLVLEILTGSRVEMKSFAQKAKENFTTKQNEQQILMREFQKLAKKNENLAEILQTIIKK